VYECGPGRSDGIATGYELDGLVFEFQWGEKFLVPFQKIPIAHQAPYTMDTWCLPGVERPKRGVY